jgi:hypothetical protein
MAGPLVLLPPLAAPEGDSVFLLFLVGGAGFGAVPPDACLDLVPAFLAATPLPLAAVPPGFRPRPTPYSLSSPLTGSSDVDCKSLPS